MEQATFVKTRDTQPVEVEVQDRRFRAMHDTTFEQDIYIMGILAESGLQELASSFDIAKDDLSNVSQQVIITAFKHGRLFELVAASMEEVGKPWTIESARANAVFFSKLTDAKDKLALRSSIVAVILGFFVSGLLSSKNSEFSSTIARGIRLEPTDPSSVSGLPEGDNTTSETGT